MTTDGVFEQQAVFDAAEKSKSKKEFWERVIYNSAIGGTKINRGINLTYAGAAFPTGGGRKVEQFRRIVANGSTTFVVGTSIWMFDTLQLKPEAKSISIPWASIKRRRYTSSIAGWRC
ncbi:MAG: hypothetical protein R3D26_21740 [Cyanobacteriota/Melainabacteria group bacterium]